MNQSDRKKPSDLPETTNSCEGAATSGQEADAGVSNQGGTDGQVGDRSGPGAGYDGEPVQVRDKGGVK